MKRFLTLAALPFLVAASAPPGDIAYDIVEGLTTEVGPRLAATEQEARAREWAVRKLKAMGFANVHIEKFAMPVWRRGIETAEVTAPFAQRLAITALGRSGATPPGGLTLPVVRFATFDEFKAAPDAAVRGKIVYVTHAMVATQDGSGYGYFGSVRRSGPAVAAAKGAAAMLIRSIGTDHSRAPHTGGTNWPEGTAPIPAAALSTADSDLLDRMFQRGKPVTIKLVLTPHERAERRIGQCRGRDPGAGPQGGRRADRRTPRQLGPGHRGDRRRGGHRRDDRRGESAARQRQAAAPDGAGRLVRGRGAGPLRGQRLSRHAPRRSARNRDRSGPG